MDYDTMARLTLEKLNTLLLAPMPSHKSSSNESKPRKLIGSVLSSVTCVEKKDALRSAAAPYLRKPEVFIFEFLNNCINMVE